MKRRYIFMLTILATCIIMLGSSFAYLKDIEESSVNASINLAKFDVQLVQDVVGVTLDKMYPMKDSEGVNNTPITFAIQNKGGVDASYRITLADGTPESGATYMKNSDVRYQLTKTIGSGTPQVLGPFTLPDSGIIDEGNITAGENNNGQTISYELVVWVDYNANPNGQKFSKYVVVDGMQVASLDTSGANFPELADNMIPVYYSEGSWKKADSKNLDSSNQWFDYNNQMWANAVTVKESGTQTRNYYLDAEVGTTIPMEDITTMWVWIPRYKYVIFNGNNETAEEQMINVTFEHGTEKTGTVSCEDAISNAANSTSSEVCTDTTNGSIVNHKSTYTHPAFTFGDEELTGFWMAKFEMSTDDSDCYNTPNETNCNKTGLNILVKPDQYSLRYENVSNMFANMRRMEIYSNIHGFNQSSSATTWLDASGNLTGEINNDNNTIDTHMIKNMEWGAVAYLSQSKYGKQGNGNYTGNYKEVYINNNSDYKTGYSGGSYDSSAGNTLNTNTYLYNNLTSAGEGRGSLGPGASTTGTVYGVFDMNGGGFDQILSNSINSDNSPNSASSDWSSTVFPINKYYDKYSYNNTTELNTKQNLGKLGDATKETIGWYSDTSERFINVYSPFFARGFPSVNRIASGIYSYSRNDGSDMTLTSRPVLTITRNMPWLNND